MNIAWMRWRLASGGVLLCFCVAGHAWAGDSLPSANAMSNSQSVDMVQPRAVSVQRDGALFHVDVVMHADVSQKVAWDVLTDFAHLAQFLPDLQSSEVTPGGDERHLTVRQSGVARFGPFSKKYESTREVVLAPPERISAVNVAGNVKSMSSVMTLAAEAGGTRLEYHADVEPGFWVPPLVGPASVKAQTAQQFSSMIAEMKRREQALHAGSPAQSGMAGEH